MKTENTITVLACNTTANRVELLLAIVDNDTNMYRSIHRIHKGKGGNLLLNEVASFLSISGTVLKSIDALICPEGPGSFTSLRTVLSVVKGIAFAENMPVITVSTLEACYLFRKKWKGLVLPVIDARTQSVFTCAARNGRLLSEYKDLPIAALPEFCNTYRKDNEAVLISGVDSLLVYQNLKGNYYHQDSTYPTLALQAILQRGIVKLRNNDVMPEDGGPYYIRPASVDMTGAENRIRL